MRLTGRKTHDAAFIVKKQKFFLKVAPVIYFKKLLITNARCEKLGY